MTIGRFQQELTTFEEIHKQTNRHHHDNLQNSITKKGLTNIKHTAEMMQGKHWSPVIDQ